MLQGETAVSNGVAVPVPEVDTDFDSSPTEEKLPSANKTIEYPSVDPADVYSYCMAQLTTCLSEMNVASSPGQSSGYQSFNTQQRPINDPFHEEGSFFSKDVQDDLEFWSLMRDEEEMDCPPPVANNVIKTFIYFQTQFFFKWRNELGDGSIG